MSGAVSLFREAPLRHKPYPGKPRLRLPDAAGVGSRALAASVRDYAPTSSFSKEPISLAELAWLLHLTNGVTGVIRGSDPPEHRRAAPSAGALYAGELYVVAERVSGLAPGVYSYAVAEHELVELRLGSPPAPVENAAALILISNVFERYTWKYRRRGWRYAFIDTGHIGENLRLAAASAGLGDASPLGFDEAALNARLDLDGEKEAVCALHAIGRRAGPVETPSTGRSVEACIESRRSARGFRSDPIAEQDLAFVLEMAQGHKALERSPGVELRIFSHRVAGLAPGLYRYLPAERRLELLRQRDDARRLVRACLFQEMAGTAAAGIVCVGDLDSAEARGGERGYRALLIEAGAIAERVYLAAEAQGLAARNLAAFFDDPLDELLELDGRTRAAIHLTMVGVER